MSTADAPVHRLTYEDVMRMFAAGVFRDLDRVELVDGLLVDVPRPSPEHSGAVSWLNRHFVMGAPELETRVQDILIVEGGFFVPDLMVIHPTPRDRHPATGELVVEVSVTTQRHDAWKASRYSGAGVREYWIVDLPARVVRVHRQPGPDGYELIAIHREGERIEAPAGAPVIDVGELLGMRV